MIVEANGPKNGYSKSSKMHVIYSASLCVILAWVMLRFGCWTDDRWTGNRGAVSLEPGVEQEYDVGTDIVKLAANPTARMINLSTTLQEEKCAEGTESVSSNASANATLPSAQSDSTAGSADHDYVDHMEEYAEEKIDKTPPRKDPEAPQPTVQQPQIATFEEWTKEKLLTKNGGNGKVALPSFNTAIPSVGEGVKAANVSMHDVELAKNASHNSRVENPPSADPTAQGQKPPAILLPVASVGDTQRPDPKMEFIANRNYASKECGAKILYANGEAENKGAILNDKEKDDYMRNPCEKAKEKFLIVELCEEIKLTLFEVANFELFSSGPKTMRLWTSERYPVVEWTLLGEFDAEPSREIQSFPVSAQASLGKFIKLELLSHHGNEHFCTLSLFRAYGITMVDEWEASITQTEAATAEPVPTSHAVPQSKISAEGNQTALNRAPNESTNSTTTTPGRDHYSTGPVGGVIRTVIDNIIEVIPKTLLPITLSGTNSTSTKGELNRYRSLEECWRCSLNDRRKTSHWLCYMFTSTSSHQNSTIRSAKARKLTGTSPLNSSAPIRQEKRDQRSEFLRAIKGRTRRRVPTTVNQGANKTEDYEIATPSQPDEMQQPVIPLLHHSKVTETPLTGSVGVLPGVSMSQKEKALMTLFKRVSALELNMSLSQEYLNELSTRYVAQSESWTRQHEKLGKSMQETVSEATEQYVAYVKEETASIRREFEKLREDIRKYEEIFGSMHAAVAAKLLEPSASTRSLVVRRMVDEEKLQGEGLCDRDPASPSGIDVHFDELSQPSIADTTTDDELDWKSEDVARTVAASQILTLLLVALLLWRCRVRKDKAMVKMTEEELKEIIRHECAKSISDSIAQLSNSKSIDVEKNKRRKHRRPVVPPLRVTDIQSAVLEESGDSAVETATNSSCLTISSNSSVNSGGGNRLEELSSELEGNGTATSTLNQSNSSVATLTSHDPHSSMISLVDNTSFGGTSERSPLWQMVGKPKRKFSTESYLRSNNGGLLHGIHSGRKNSGKGQRLSQLKPLSKCPE